MHHIIYLSRTTQQLKPEELTTILVQARQSNDYVGITGALVYGEGKFMQILEGEKPAITALYERIVGDPRHRAIVKLADKPIEERTFLNWSMAFRELVPEQARALEGYLSPAQWEEIGFSTDSADAVLLEHMRGIIIGNENL
jgi:hypothetical protein